MSKQLPYRDCVGVMILNAEGLVFTGHRKMLPEAEETGTSHLWQMPQGGIDKGEDPLKASRREMWEETGIKSVHLLAEAPNWISYDLPEHMIGVALKGKFRGQRQKWFAYRFDGDESEIAINPPPDGNHPEFDAWKWRPMHELPGLVVLFKRKVYEEVVAAFAHLAGN